ncbi:OstA-like protein [Draconibacterium sp. IB214405]|uniref:OstA-like protein n=1 Tax=Draconibacterium sp. IB214405 TaxID=3097352 RepID=UPI002A1029CD|nr:OstA-like protein [Draconibacterium sp. IB214405]MDX8340389.1 OstA-like protein [Draconibacterium sp. IB214405]
MEIIQAESLVQSQSIANAQRLVNDVIIKHEGIMMYCDSAYTYEGSNRVDAFGNVHINQGDTLHLYARKVYYDGDRSFAQAIKNVKLVNPEITLYTDTLDYDMNLNVGYYDCGGKIVDSTNTLTSKVGQYFLDDNEAHFTDSVVGFSDKYTIDSEDLRYNTQTEVIFFKGPTTIRDSVNTLYAEDGWYNTQTGEADLNLHPMVYNDTQSIKAKQISYNKENGDGLAIGDVFIEDFENRTIIQGNKVIYNEEKETAIATDSAVFITYNETDSLFLHADTLKSIPDTIDGENLVMAYYGVRFFRNDIQGLCDSLMYFTKDSLVQLHRNPVIWSEQHQLSADYIEMIQHTTAPNEMHLKKNSFIISKQDSGRYDQIKGKNMTGYIVNGKLRNIDVDGNGQTLYYARDKEAVIGLNRAESSNIGIRFKEGKIDAIAFQKQPEGQLKPILKLDESEKTLPGFEWKIKLRPLSKDDIFWRPEKKEVTEEEEKVTGQ